MSAGLRVQCLGERVAIAEADGSVVELLPETVVSVLSNEATRTALRRAVFEILNRTKPKEEGDVVQR